MRRMWHEMTRATVSAFLNPSMKILVPVQRIVRIVIGPVTRVRNIPYSCTMFLTDMETTCVM